MLYQARYIISFCSWWITCALTMIYKPFICKPGQRIRLFQMWIRIRQLFWVKNRIYIRLSLKESHFCCQARVYVFCYRSETPIWTCVCLSVVSVVVYFSSVCFLNFASLLWTVFLVLYIQIRMPETKKNWSVWILNTFAAK